MAYAEGGSLRAAVEPSRQRTLQRVYEVGAAYFALTKPRIILLQLFTAYCAMLVAYGHVPGAGLTIATLVGLGMSGGGAASINMWYDRDIDRVMRRTRGRPVPAGLVRASGALWFGLALGVVSTVELILTTNLLTAALSVFGYIYYSVIYTMWLKRTTPQNIVIGGGAGAIPPVVGWVAVTNHLDLGAILLFAVIFLWTPPHFWALALYKNEDYVKAGIPMLPAVRGARQTKVTMVIYAMLLLASVVAADSVFHLGVFYTWSTVVLGGAFALVNVRLLFEPDDVFVWARRTFFASLWFLPAWFMLSAVLALR